MEEYTPIENENASGIAIRGTGMANCTIFAVALSLMTAKGKPAGKEHAHEVGERIRARRIELGLSQRELALQLRTRKGTPQSVTKISQWELGHSIPEHSKRPELADVLQTSISALFGEPEDARLLSRLDHVERRLDAVIRLQGLGDAVDVMTRASHQADRRKAQETAQGLVELRKESVPRSKPSAKGNLAAGD